jgi:hypothetical protein
MNLTGGIAWHWLAWRSQARWASTSQAIAHWLLHQAHVFKASGVADQPSLLLIGASAGWMMSSQWLQQFARIDTFDIDPLAAPLFKWRHDEIITDSWGESDWEPGFSGKSCGLKYLRLQIRPSLMNYSSALHR